MIRTLTFLFLSFSWFPASGLHAAAADAQPAPSIDTYQAMRDRCGDAGEDSRNRCQQDTVKKSAYLRRECDEKQERARRLCILGVMEQQNRDIQGATR